MHAALCQEGALISMARNAVPRLHFTFYPMALMAASANSLDHDLRVLRGKVTLLGDYFSRS
jgi:hypothetical protein